MNLPVSTEQTKGHPTTGDHDGSGRPAPSRILMVAPQPFFRARGTPFSVLHRIRALTEAGYTVDLVTYPFGEDVPMAGLRIFRSARVPFIRDIEIGPSFPKLFLDLPLLLTTVGLLKRNQYDVLHSHEEAAFFSVYLARRYRLPHIYDMHSSLPLQLKTFSAYDLGPVRKIFEWFERKVLTTCDGIITICDELAEIAKETAPDTPHSMIENTADDTKVFGRSHRQIRTEYRLSGKKVMLYTGTFEKYQGLDLLLSAFGAVVAQFPRAHLILVGGRQPQIDEYQSMATDLGLTESVTFSGSVHPSEIPAFFAATDIIVSPRSRGTNTPLKIYGYMRSGLPLVATDKLTHTQTLDKSIAELVAPTPEGLAEGMLRLLNDEAYCKRLASAARARSDEKYSDASYMAKVHDFYDAAFRSHLTEPLLARAQNTI